ncbi:hypothetical protein BpHYR1_005485 [Brachionus plicatilis]|uniref:Uncharacterized protein n=1 Tax=Brachionus plicatilis TaxID=10195 RepID=A0A3M7PFA5_BRAPC|nr:hypothetical protein BpHYR1_005485 [Brachionus plicatilis]
MKGVLVLCNVSLSKRALAIRVFKFGAVDFGVNLVKVNRLDKLNAITLSFLQLVDYLSEGTSQNLLCKIEISFLFFETDIDIYEFKKLKSIRNLFELRKRLISSKNILVFITKFML